ncbi:hypothetical protein AVEN_93083-1 [Araneus ventricosus]|uniref:Uncharacterized protein n=1 Tax=Araneus ventricosus TaxID=182803 RepID=A0A4Y2J3C0_ARAVE|nr:hypothetical protein AVEN_93083-1 [Araneus ventricosus]
MECLLRFPNTFGPWSPCVKVSPSGLRQVSEPYFTEDSPCMDACCPLKRPHNGVVRKFQKRHDSSCVILVILKVMMLKVMRFVSKYRSSCFNTGR